MKCPFCAEDIQPDARKCKHCGEWLDQPNEPDEDRGSAQARAVTKGLKRKEQDDMALGCYACSWLLGGCVLGGLITGVTNSFAAGFAAVIIVFFVGAAVSGKWYYRE